MSGLASLWVMRDPSKVGWFATALRDAMADRGLSVGALARTLETSPSLVRKWRAGTSVPSVERAADIAQAVGVPYETLCVPTSGVGGVERRRDPMDVAELDADLSGAPRTEELPPANGELGHGTV